MKTQFLLLLLFFGGSDILAQSNLTKLSYAELDSLMYIEYDKGDFKKAIPYMQVARAKAKAEFGVQDSVYALYSDNLGAFYYETGQYQQAELLFLESKAILEKTSTKEDPLYVVGLNNLAVLYEVMGKYEQAEALHLEAKNIRAKLLGKEHPDYARSLNNLAVVYSSMGNYAQAELLNLEAKTIWEKTLGKEHPDYAASLANLAVLYENMGNFAKAEGILLESKAIYTKIYGKNHQEYVRCLNSLAGVYENLDNLTQAEQLYVEASAILEKTRTDDFLYAMVLSNLAELYQIKKQFGQAESLYLNSLAIRAKMVGKEHPSYASSLASCAVLYLNMGKLDTAFKYCLASIHVNSSQLDSTFIDFNTLDKFDYYSNKWINFSIKTMLEIFQAQFEKTGDKAKLEAQYRLAQTGMRLNERIRNNLSAEGDKLRVLAENTHFVRQGIEAAVRLKKKSYQIEAFGFAEMNKSILLADAVKGNRARTLGDLPDTLAEQEITLQQQLAQLKKEQLEAKDPVAKEQINQALTELNFEINTFLQSLKNKYPKYHSLKYENITPKAADIQALLNDPTNDLGTGKTALLEYFLADSVVYLFVVTKTDLQLHAIPVQAKELKNKIKILRNALSNYSFITKNKDEAHRDYVETAHWFYKKLVEPATNNRNIQTLNIVTDGDLGHLPFETFLVEPASQKKEYNNLHYLVNDYNISYNYSATLWRENIVQKRQKNKDSKGASQSKILACAATYNPSDNSLEQVRLPYFYRLRKVLRPLPAAQNEVTALSENFQGNFLLGEASNERFFKEHAHQYGIIHLAMHGILDPTQPMLSSLAFTENRDSLEDNFLQAFEISRLKLNANLIVLSACETGYGKFEQGEGVVSLARAFMYAGVPSLVVSLWQVSDASTAAIMKIFYENLASGMPKNIALRQAKLNYIKVTQGIAAHPAFWSPFILMGDESPISISQKCGYLWWGLVVLALVVVAAGGWIMNKRKEV